MLKLAPEDVRIKRAVCVAVCLIDDETPKGPHEVIQNLFMELCDAEDAAAEMAKALRDLMMVELDSELDREAQRATFFKALVDIISKLPPGY